MTNKEAYSQLDFSVRSVIEHSLLKSLTTYSRHVNPSIISPCDYFINEVARVAHTLNEFNPGLLNIWIHDTEDSL